MAATKKPAKSKSSSTPSAHEATFEPRIIRLNGKDLLVELPATCERVWNVETICDRWPGILDGTYALTAEEEETVEKLHVLTFVGFEKTVSVYFMQAFDPVIWPSDIIFGTKTSSGHYEVVSLIVNGKKMRALRMSMHVTSSANQDKITVNRDTITVNQRAREAVQKIQKGEIPAAVPKSESPSTVPPVETKFEPRTIRLNGETFLVELPPGCRRCKIPQEWDSADEQYFLNPELMERAEKEHVWCFVGFEKTVRVYFWGYSSIVWPSDIIYGEKTSSGSYDVVSLIVDGSVIKPQRMEIVATGSWDKDRIIVIRDSLAVYQRTQEAVEKIKKGEIPAAAPIATNANAQMTTTVPTDEPQSHKVRNPKGREPATREAIQADNDIARRWQEFRTGEASGPDANRKPTLTDFSRSILNSTHLKTKQIEEALERVRKRKRMKSRLSGN